MLLTILIFCSAIIYTSGHGFKTPEKFTDFINEAIQILQTYEDSDLENFFNVFNTELRKYHYRGCKFHELLDKAHYKQLLADRLDAMAKQPAAEIREGLAALSNKIKHNAYGKQEKDLINLVNSLYRNDSKTNFKTVLNNMEQYKNSNSRKDFGALMGIVSGALKSTLFDHYTDLNRRARIALRTKINEVWHDFVDDASSRLLRSFLDGSITQVLGSLNINILNTTNITIVDNKKKVDKVKQKKPQLGNHKGKKIKRTRGEPASKGKETTKESDDGFLRLIIVTDTNSSEHTTTHKPRVDTTTHKPRVDTTTHKPRVDTTTDKPPHINTILIEIINTQPTKQTRKYRHRVHNTLTTPRRRAPCRGTTITTKHTTSHREPPAEQLQPEDKFPEEKRNELILRRNNETELQVVANFF